MRIAPASDIGAAVVAFQDAHKKAASIEMA